MDTNELLNRIKQRDPNAYLQLTKAYGWKLYSHLRTQFDDPKMADAAFTETLTNFYNTIAEGNGDDAVEMLLMAYGDMTCQQMKNTQDSQKPASMAQPAKSGGFGFGLGVGILVLGILAALWVIVGLLMDMSILPNLDLGYSWFNANIAPWF